GERAGDAKRPPGSLREVRGNEDGPERGHGDAPGGPGRAKPPRRRARAPDRSWVARSRPGRRGSSRTGGDPQPGPALSVRASPASSPWAAPAGSAPGWRRNQRAARRATSDRLTHPGPWRVRTAWTLLLLPDLEASGLRRRRRRRGGRHGDLQHAVAERGGRL